MWLLNQGIGDDRPVLEHILQIDQLTVGDRPRHIAHVVNVDNSLIMGTDHFLRENVSAADILGNLRCQIVPHSGIQHRVLVCVLLFRQLIVVAEEREDFCVRAVPLPQKLMPEPVVAVVPGKPVCLGLIQLIDHHVLDFFHRDTPACRFNPLFDPANNKTNHHIRQPVLLCHLTVGGFDGAFYLFIVIWDFSPVPLDDLQRISSSIFFWASARSSSQPFPR